MLQRLKALFGRSGAKIDLVLAKERAELGDTLQGEFRLEGGTAELSVQEIRVELELEMQFKDGLPKKRTVKTESFPNNFLLQAGEQKTLPFLFKLDKDLPITSPGAGYKLKTRMLTEGRDSVDEDEVIIRPADRVMQIFRACKKLGMREQHDSGTYNGYAQEFSYFPPERFAAKLQEIEFMAAPEKDGVRVLIELDLLKGMGFDEIESRVEVFLPDDLLQDTDALGAYLMDKIGALLDDPSTAYRSGRRQLHGAIGQFVYRV